MSDLLYDTYKEYSRIVEEVVVTEEGMFRKQGVPTSYAGAKLSVELVHTVHMVNSAGNLMTLEFHNPPPLNLDKSTTIGAITVDGASPTYPANGHGVAGGGDVRTWVTRYSTMLPSRIKQIGDKSMAIRNAS